MAFKIKYPEGYEQMQQEKAMLMLAVKKPVIKEALKELPVKEVSKSKPEGDK